MGSTRAVAVSAASALVLLVGFASCSGTSKPPPPAGITNTSDASESADVTQPPGGDSSTTPPADASQTLEAAAEASSGVTTDAGPTCAATDPDATDVKPMMCGTMCVNIATDTKNCGGCSQPCNLGGEICDFGMCRCPATQSVCAGQCVDLTQDPTNCGSCGHNCQGDTCATGVCQARVIATVQIAPHNLQSFAIAVDSSTVYWTEGNPGSTGNVFWKAVAAMMTPNVLGGTNDPRGIVADLNYVYWVDYSDGSVNRGSIIGGSSVGELLGPGDSGVAPGSLALAVDANNVYWVNSAEGTVNMIPKAPGGTPQTLYNVPGTTPRAIAVDATYVYWIDYGSLAKTGSVNRIPIKPVNGAWPNVPLSTGENQPYSIAVDGTSVYWTNRTSPDGTVRSVPIGGGTSHTLAQGQGNPDGIAIDSQYVYWANFNDNTVMKAPLAGGTPYTIASAQNNPSEVAVDSNSVFWANYGNGSIMKVAK